MSFSWSAQLFRTGPDTLFSLEAFRGFILEKALLTLGGQLQNLVSGWGCQTLSTPRVGYLIPGTEPAEVIGEWLIVTLSCLDCRFVTCCYLKSLLQVPHVPGVFKVLLQIPPILFFRLSDPPFSDAVSPVLKQHCRPQEEEVFTKVTSSMHLEMNPIIASVHSCRLIGSPDDARLIRPYKGHHEWGGILTSHCPQGGAVSSNSQASRTKYVIIRAVQNGMGDSHHVF